MNELEQFLKLNNIRLEELFDAIHMDIRETILKITCEKLKKDEMFNKWAKKVFFLTKDELGATKKIIDRACKCSLPENDTIWMKNCIKAFFDKSSVRETISREEKEQLLKTQENKCAICGRSISLNNMHVDHIIPWDYVGDRLSNNYQGLCKDCNLSKSNHVAQTVANLIIYREEKK